MARNNTPGQAGIAIRSCIRTAVYLLVLAGLFSHTVAIADGLEEIRAAIRLRDYETAVPLLETLANTGNPAAQYQLAALYRSGNGVPKNHERAFALLHKAAQQSHRQAEYNLGAMYENGWGTPASEADARHWYSKAAAQGHPMALEKLNISNIAARRTKDDAPPDRPANQDAILRRAAIRGDLQTAAKSIKHGSNVNTADKYGRTALIESAERGFTTLVRLLATNNANINHKDIYDNSALHVATGHGHLDTVKALLNAGADINITDARGNTPLMIASGKNNMEIVRSLTGRGARLHNKNTTGDTAADIATRKHHDDILKHLQANGAYPVKHFGQKNASAAKRLTLQNSKLVSSPAVKDIQRPYEGWPPLMEAAWRG